MKKSKTNLKLKRVVSLIFAAVMVCGVGTAIFLSTGINAKAALSVSTDAPDVTIIVPDTVYVKPSDKKTFEFYLNNDSSGAAKSGASSTGSVYFSCSGATNIKATLSDSSVSGISVNNGSETGFSGNLSSELAASTGIGTGTKQLKWTFTYTVGSVNYTSYAYTTAYSPYTGTTGAMAEAGNGYTSGLSSESIYVGSILWWQGINGVASYVTQSNIDNRNITGQDPDEKGIYVPNTSMFDPMVNGITATGGKSDPQGWFTSVSSNATFARMRYKSTGSAWRTCFAYGATASLIADSSRYTNINQIPNVKCGFYLTDTEHVNEMKTYYLTKYTGTCYMGCSAGDPTNHENANPSHEDYKGPDKIYNGANADLKISGDSYSSYGSIYSGSVSYSISGNNTYNFAVHGYAHGHREGKNYAYVANSLYAPIKITAVNKKSLRSTIATQLKPSTSYPSDLWSAYQTALQNAYAKLGDPTVSDLGSVESTLQTAINNLKATSTATAIFWDDDANAEIPTTIQARETISYKFGDTVTATKNDISGYTFTGIVDVSNYGSATPEDIDGGKKVKNINANDLTFKFHYTPKQSTVNFNMNGAYTTQAAYTLKIGANMTTVTPPRRNGYNFNGYFLGDVRYYNADGTSARSWDQKDGATLTAQWTPVTYTVKYDGNGATSGNMSNGTFTFDETVVPASTLKREYTVTYNTNDTGMAKTDGSPYTAATHTTQTATATMNGWEDTSTYTYNGTAYGPTAFSGPYYANKYGDLLNAFGYNKLNLINHYVSWTVNGTENRISYAADGTPLFYKVDSNGAPVKDILNLSTTQGATVTLKANWTLASLTVPSGPDRPGYTFNGWYDAASGGNKVTTFTPTSNRTLYAHWSPISYSITYDVNKPSNASSNPAQGTPSASVVFAAKPGSITVPSLTGWTFQGYYTEKSGGTQIIKADGTAATGWYFPSSKTLYAHWTANTYTVVYNGNGNDGGSMTSSSHTYDTAKALTANGFTKTGYSFAGWAASANGAVVYTNKQSVINLTAVNGGTVNLYAKWTINKYPLNLAWDMTDASGKEVSITEVKAKGMAQAYITAEISASAVDTYTENNTFETQYTIRAEIIDKDKYILSVNNGASFETSETRSANIPVDGRTVKFHIRPVYSVEFNTMGTSTSPADAFGAWTPVKKAYGTTITVPTQQPTRAGYEFAFWTDRYNNPYYPGQTVSITPNDLEPGEKFELYAQWRAKTYTVTFDEQMDGYGYNLFDSASVCFNQDVSNTSGTFSNDGVTYKYDNGVIGIGGKPGSDSKDPYILTGATWNAGDYIFEAKNLNTNVDPVNYSGYGMGGSGLWLYMSANRNGGSSPVRAKFTKPNENKLYNSYFAEDITSKSSTSNGDFYFSPLTDSVIFFDIYANVDKGDKLLFSVDVALYHGFENQTYDSAMRKNVKVPSWGDYTFLGYYNTPNGTPESSSVKYYNADGTPTNNVFHESNTDSNGYIRLYAHWRNKSVYFDVNGVLDGVESGNIEGFGKIDVCIKEDGKPDYIEKGITDFYKDYPWGAEFSVSNLEQMTGKTYEGYRVQYGDDFGEILPALTESGEYNTITGTTTSKGETKIWLYFHTNHYNVIYNSGDANATGGPAPERFTYGGDKVLKDGSAFTNNYTITFEYNGANAGNGTAKSIVSCAFLGWSDTEINPSVKYQAGTAYPDFTDVDEKDVNLYAVWSTGQIILPSPAKLGYTFEGWYEDEGLTVPAGGEGKNHGADRYTPSGSYKLYAKWKKVVANNVYIPYDFTSDNMSDVIIIRHFLKDNDTFLEDGKIKDGNTTIGSVRLGTSIKSGRTLGTSTTSSSLSSRVESVENSAYKVELGGKKSNQRYSKEDALLKISIKSLTVSQKLYYEYHYADNNYDQYIGGEIVLVPANSVYYDEKQFNYSGSSIGTEVDGAASWAEVTALGDGKATEEVDTPYGYMGQSNKYNAQSFSNGYAMRVAVNAANQVSKTAEYTYTGKGFDLYSACGNENAVLMVYVWAKDGDSYIPVANSAVDTYMETDMKIKKPGQETPLDLLRQVPVYHFTTEETGTYLVQVYALWMEELAASSNGEPLAKSAVADEIEALGLQVNDKLFDLQWVDENSVFNGGTGSAELKTESENRASLNKSTAKPATLYGYIDGIRVYNPAETSGTYANGYDACYNEDEKNASFYNIKQFTRSGDDVAEYTGYSINTDVSSPINEVYLAGGGKTALKIDGYRSGITVMLSMRAVTGDSDVDVYPTSGKRDGIKCKVKSGTEMYFDISDKVGSDGMIYIQNGPGNTVALCNVKVSAGSYSGDVQPSLVTLTATELQNAMLFMSKSTAPCENEYSYVSPGVVGVALENNVPDPKPETEEPGGNTDEPGGNTDEPGGNTEEPGSNVKYTLRDLGTRNAGYKKDVTAEIALSDLPAGCTVKIDNSIVPVVDGKASKNFGRLKDNKTFTVQVLSGDKVLSEKQATIKVPNQFLDKVFAFFGFIFNFFKWGATTVKF